MSEARQALLVTLSRRGALPVGALARAIHHSTMATRYHLSLLLDAGLVVAENVAHSRTAGRPQLLYALAERGQERLPKEYHGLAEQLLQEVGNTLGERELRALLRRAGKRLAATAPPLRRGARVETRLDRAAEFLSAHGYLAHWDRWDNGYALHVCNCPYRQVALTHRQVCEMDMAMIGGLVDLPMKMTDCIASSGARCSFVLRATARANKVAGKVAL